ncbi:MAG TPA: hypothetical protein VN700_05425 [Vicinamibacterales bacterium]|nr:hypothetical protein [Vicinamibacterales bacterium]
MPLSSSHAVSLGLSLTVVLSVSVASTQLPRKPPIVDLTTSLGILHADGTHDVQTNTLVGPGRPSPAGSSDCIESATRNAGATCVNVCVRMPPGSTLTKVQTIAAEAGKPGGPCGRRICLGQPVSAARAMFDAAGYTRDQDFGYDRVCWIFRNWHPTISREVWLIVSLKSPSHEEWRAVAGAYPWKKLQNTLERFVGTTLVDCGQHRNPGWGQPIEKQKQIAALKASLACAQQSAKSKTPFWTAQLWPGIDSISFDGLLGQRDGSVHVFNACPGCSRELSMKWCLEPAVEADSSGNSKFGCSRWASSRATPAR